MTKNTSIVLVAAVVGIMIAGTLAIVLPTVAFAKYTEGKGGIGEIGDIGIQKGNANGGSANGGDGGDANGGLAFCKFVKLSCN